MRRLPISMLLLLAGRFLYAQCPDVGQFAPVATNLCDNSNNLFDLWSSSVWYDTLHQSNNLAESVTEIKIVFGDPCLAAHLSLSYTIFLDLNNDGQPETAVNSDSLPPAGTVRYGNMANAGYTGGVSAEFDQRVVPASKKYRFALDSMTQANGLLTGYVRWNTTELPFLFFNPALPYGHHTIEWHLEAGNVRDTFRHSFTIRDCAAPTLQCVQPLQVFLNAQGKAQVGIAQLLHSVSDNITPVNQLVLGIRKQGTGNSFPIDSSGNPTSVIEYDCSRMGLPNIAELWARDKSGNASSCTVALTISDSAGYCAPLPPLKVCLFHPTLGVLPGLAVNTILSSSNAPDMTLAEVTDTSGCTEFDFPPFFNGFYAVTPERDDAPLAGVSTFDLVLISKHILALEALDSPEKMIAADVSRNGSITTFDIVELRKLLLGIYQTFPINRSWRFVDNSFVFPNPQNPFQTPFPETATGSTADMSPVYFEGIKIGDVNNSISFQGQSDDRNRMICQLENPDLTAGETRMVEFLIENNRHLQALQVAFSYDASCLSIESVTSADLPEFSPENWAMPEPGALTLAWHTTQTQGQAARLKFQIRAACDGPLSDYFKLSPSARLKPEAYEQDGTAHPLMLAYAATHQQDVTVHPNPTSGDASLRFSLSVPDDIRCQLYDASGRRCLDVNTRYEAGLHNFTIPAEAMRETGVYFWKINTPDFQRTGSLLKTD